MNEVQKQCNQNLPPIKTMQYNRELHALQAEMDKVNVDENLIKQVLEAEQEAKKNWLKEDFAEHILIPYNMHIEKNLKEKKKWLLCDFCSNTVPVRDDFAHRIAPFLASSVVVKLETSEEVAFERLQKKSHDFFVEFDKLYLKEGSQSCIDTVQESVRARLASLKEDVVKQYRNKHFFSLKYEDVFGDLQELEYDVTLNTGDFFLHNDNAQPAIHTQYTYKNVANTIVALLKKKCG